MKHNILGVTLQFYRKKYMISQNALCEGICSVATLSRIEKGNSEADSAISENLLDRIGKETVRLDVVLNNNDYEFLRIREKIRTCEIKKDIESAQVLLNDFQKLLSENDKMNQQFFLLYDAKVKLQKEYHKEKICSQLIKALKVTKPKFDITNTRDNLYHSTEIEIILLLIELECPLWKTSQMEELLVDLLDNVKKIYTGRKREKYVVAILERLLKVKEQLLDDKKIIIYADEVITFLSEEGELR